MIELLKQISRDLGVIRELLGKIVFAQQDAEREIPEYMRRFVNYMHDVRDIANIYEERGHTVPNYILREMERCDDRFRQLLDRAHTDGGAFEKIRREMADDVNNRWDHTRFLPKPEDKK